MALVTRRRGACPGYLAGGAAAIVDSGRSSRDFVARGVRYRAHFLGSGCRCPSAAPLERPPALIAQYETERPAAFGSSLTSRCDSRYYHLYGPDAVAHTLICR